MNAKVLTIMTAHTAKYQSLPLTVMWLSVNTVLVKPFWLRALLRLKTDIAMTVEDGAGSLLPDAIRLLLDGCNY